MLDKVKRLVFGDAKNPLDRNVFHKINLIAFLAWVGMGADGLSSSAYGPEETYRALGAGHHHLALYLAAMMALTVFVISASYNQTIEHFPSGGGGYVVASKLLSPWAGLVSGCALVVDYVLTIAISIAAGVDAVCSFPALHSEHKLVLEAFFILLLIWLNLRGIKESIKVLLPIFLVFVATHVLLIGAGLGAHFGNMGAMVAGTVRETRDMVALPHGWWLFLVAFFTAYSLGGGTYTGIEAVSNGLSSLREPRVKTGKRTMLYMALSLAFTAGGILLLYMLWDIQPVEGQTMNSVLAQAVFGGWAPGGFPLGTWLVLLTILSEGLLLFIAAQTGFIDGPNVLANMAVDSWMPHRFANLSHRLVRMNGILVMGVASLAVLFLTHGEVAMLVVLYAINVFLTFCLSQLSMCVHWWQVRKTQKDWLPRFLINGLGFSLTSLILTATICTKFLMGAWETLVCTLALVAFCLAVRRHYDGTRQALKRLDDALTSLPLPDLPADPSLGTCDPKKPTAVVLVGSYNGLGIHAVFSIRKLFDDKFKDWVFVSIGQIDSSRFKGVEELDNLRESTERSLAQYVELAHRMGYRAESRSGVAIDVIGEMEKTCALVSKQFRDPTFFCGKLIFARENLFSALLHNQTSLEIQRRLLFEGLQTVVVPVRVLEPA